MRLSLALLSTIAFPMISAINIPMISPTNFPMAAEYADLYSLCKAGGPDTIMVLRYERGPPKTRKFGECAQMNTPDQGMAELVLFCKHGTCKTTQNPNCEPGEEVVTDFPIVPGAYGPGLNVWAKSTLGSSGSCKPNGLSNLPFP